MELINSRKESTLSTGERLTQPKRVIKHLALKVEMGVGVPSKHLLFLSVHKHHKIQAGTKDQICLTDFPTFQELQHTKTSLNDLGMTQVSPKSEKNMFHRPVATVQ